MLRRALLLSITVLASSAAISAQSTITLSPKQCVWHAGDDSAWAAPSLDDSDWQPLTAWKRQTSSPVFWIRCHADLSGLSSLTAPALEITLYDAYQAYFNGTAIGSAGDSRQGTFDLNAIRIFPFAPGQAPSGISNVALRVANRVLLTNSGPINGLIGSDFALRAGDASLLDALRARAVLSRASQYFGSAACFSIIGVMAMMLLVLYLYDRSRRELLFLSVACLSLTVIRLNELATSAYLPYPIRICLLVVLVGNVILTATQTPFYFALADRRLGPLISTVIVVNCCCYFPNAVDVFFPSGATAWLGTPTLVFIRPLSLFLHVVLSCSAFVAFWPWHRIQPRARPLAFLCMLWATADLLWFLAEITAIPVPGIPNVFAAWGVPLLEARGFITAGVIIVLLGLLFRDQRRTTIEHAALAAELEAARVVQQVLIPEEIPHVPGFRIDSIYKPASQVGGDFFQIVSTDCGGALIAIGDVSGKGMPAAMTVSLLVGTFRTLTHYIQSPGQILSAMNQRMMARSGSGFTTCLVLRVDSDGMLTAANAGHLAPYLDGNELALENGLPLGLNESSTYPESTFRLGKLARLTLLTDGVPEARDAHGDLFGFERAAAISTENADQIAGAAEQFGQEDDITVLTVSFAPVEVLHA